MKINMESHHDKEIKEEIKIPSILYFEILAYDVEYARKFYSKEISYLQI
jgi:hypothetical protein